MRILYSHRIQSRDGQSVHVEELIHAFRQAGHEVLVVGPGFYEASEFGGESRMVALLRRLLPGFLQEIAELAYNLPAWWRLRKAWKSFRPDFVYERANLYFLAGALLARIDGATLFLEVNAPLAEERAKFNGLRLRRLAAALERWTWRSANRILPVTRVLGDRLLAGGVSPDRVRVVPNGIVLDRFPLGVVPRQGVTLGFVGFVRAWHGLDTVIDALAREPDAASLRLVVVGDGPVRAELETQAKALGVSDRVRFTGLVAHDQVASHVLGFDIALQPSVTEYASPLKIFDYMASGCAIVAPDQPNIREILQDGQTALLFDPSDPKAQWAAIARLLRQPDLRLSLGAAARTRLIEQDHTWSGNARRIAAWARELGAGRT